MFSYGDVVIYGEKKYKIIGREPDGLYMIRDIFVPWLPAIKAPESCLKTDYGNSYLKASRNSYKGGYLDPRYTPSKVIFNPPATVVFWEDGTKTVVKCKKGEVFSPDAGYSIALARKLYGNNFRKIFKQVNVAWCDYIDKAFKDFSNMLNCNVSDIPDPKFHMDDEVLYLHEKKVYSVVGIRRRTDAEEWEYKLHSDTCADHYMAESNLRKA